MRVIPDADMMVAARNSALYVSDLDGTLLRGDHTLSDYSRALLSEMLGEGLAFTVASARSVVSMREVLGDLPLRLPIIEFNGAFLSDLSTGAHIVTNAIAPDIAGQVLALFHRRGCVPAISTFNGREDRLYFADVGNDGMRGYFDSRTAAGDPRVRRIDSAAAALCDQVVCFTMIALREALLEIQAEIRCVFGETLVPLVFEGIFAPGWWWMTVHDRRATKDQAIRTLAEWCGRGLNHLTVFGDEVNDIPMFRAARRAVAVANAKDALKRHATEIIGSNDEDSVVKYIAADFRG